MDDNYPQNVLDVMQIVQSALTDDSRQHKYRDRPLPAGCCYAASEALYYLTDRELKPSVHPIGRSETHNEND